MNNEIFWTRVINIFVLVTLTFCYIFGDVIHSWWDWFSGFVYGGAIWQLKSTFDKKRRK